MILLEIVAGTLPTPGTLSVGGAAAAGAGFLEIMAWVGGTISVIGIAAGTLIKIFGKQKNGSAPAAPAVPVTDPVILVELRNIVERVDKVEANTLDLRDSHVGIATTMGEIKGKLDMIITLLKPVGGQ